VSAQDLCANCRHARSSQWIFFG